MRDKSWARTNTQKATAYAELLKNVFTPLPSTDSAKDYNIAYFFKSPNQLCFCLKTASPREIHSEIKSLSPNKSPGYDLLDPNLLNNLPQNGIMLLVVLFNAFLRLYYYPPQWKNAQVFMILKPGKPPEEASSYRPISLLPLLGKLFYVFY
ncbi:RNA-directed DNA polymerase from mobile element jockey like protein [Danaus plexippus plexippus]|uniref:RNA-directed DNA polymerase from mobile element jockey like protein n=1 Tax=Danaus plexippus plexippus TaxID=278856 RepID=A0A212EK66_DANPL|nr:RNA-directed DNA polymerase from mobile element jockey like protein [Danaus plexippus plexippus]